MQFQPKIIIGSIVGFISTAIAIIAVFFPSLFNLEKKDIVTYKETLVNVGDFIKLIDFLQKHQEEIVNLDLTYFEKNRCFYKSHYDYSNNNMGAYSFTKDILEEDTEGGNGNGENLVGELDNEGRVIVSSKYIMGLFMQSFFRHNGGFGIWIKGSGDSIEDRFKTDKNYIIDIPRDSDGNTLYTWNMRDYGHKEEMRLIGTFFVEKFIDSLKYTKQSGSSMSHEWEESSCDGDICNDITIIELNPISKKELQMRKY